VTEIPIDYPAAGEEWAKQSATPARDRALAAIRKRSSYLTSANPDHHRLVELVDASEWSFDDRMIFFEALADLPARTGPTGPRYREADLRLILDLAAGLRRVPTKRDLERAFDKGLIAGNGTETTKVRRLLGLIAEVNLDVKWWNYAGVCENSPPAIIPEKPLAAD